MSQPKNPSAFPSGDMRGCEPGYGITLRDWFAGKALISIADRPISHGLSVIQPGSPMHPDKAARVAYLYADAMLAERAKPVTVPAESLQHVAYFDEGEFHWMSGIAPRDCELFAKAKGGAA